MPVVYVSIVIIVGELLIALVLMRCSKTLRFLKSKSRLYIALTFSEKSQTEYILSRLGNAFEGTITVNITFIFNTIQTVYNLDKINVQLHVHFNTMFSLISCCSLNITCWRDKMDVSDQAGKAAAAALTAASISSWVASGTLVITSFVALKYQNKMHQLIYQENIYR